MDVLCKDSSVNGVELFSNADLRRLLIPLVIEQFLWCAVGMADTMMVSSLGEASVSGVALADMVNGFIINCFAALATGGAVVTSQYIGGKQLASARGSAKQLLMVVCFIAFVIAGLTEVWSAGILRLLFGELEPDVNVASVNYLRITTLSFPFVGVFNACGALFRSMNRARLSLYSAMVSNVVNIFGNAFLIFVMKMGVEGAAISTVAARGFSMLMMLYQLCDQRNVVSISFREKWRLDWRNIWRILSIGIPSGIENGIFQLGRLIVVGVIASFGTVQIASNAVANNIDYFGCLVGSAFGLAMITVVGQSVGTGQKAVVKFYVRKMMKLVCTWHLIWNLLVFALTPFVLKCYHLGDEAYKLTWLLIIIHNGIGMFLWPWSFVLPNVLRSANDVQYTMYVSVGSMIIVRVGFAHLLGGEYFLAWGAVGVWIAMVLDWVVRIALFSYRFMNDKWLKHSHCS